MDAHHNADDTNKSISTAYLEKANDDIMSIGEPQTPDDLSKYDGCYDSQALIGEMGVHGVRNIAFNQDTVFAVDIKRLIVRAFLRRTTEFPYISIYAKICDIEACEDSELIENIAYNVNDDSLLVLIENRDTQTSQLLSFSIGSIRAHRPYPAKKLVDCLDFDVPSNRAMSYDETRGVFIIYDLIDYEPKFELADTTIDIADFRFRSYQKNSYMMMFNSKNRNNKTMAASRGFLPNSVVPAFFYSKEDGKAKYNKAVELPLKVTKVAIKFLELLGERVLLSQWEEGGFLILDVSSDGIENFPMNIIRTSIESDVAPRYLSKTREFFTFNFWGTVQIYNLDGDLVRSLEDHCVGVSQDSSDPTNAFNLLSYVTSDEEIIISYCQSPVGYSINVSSLRTGKCLGKIANKVLDSEAITVLTYDEKTHEIITGNDAGFVRVWVNRFINPSHPS